MLRRKSRDSLTYFASKLSGLPVIKDTIGKLDSLSRGHSISFLRCYRVLTQKQHFHRASGLSLTPEEFENILKVLSTKIAFISMGEALELIKNKERLSESYAVLTFDEGYIETLKNTNAILKKLNIPACMFTTTQHFAKKTYKNHLWNDLVSEYVAQKSPSIIKLPWMDKTLHTDTPAKLAESNRRIIRHLVWCDDARRKFLIADFLNQDILTLKRISNLNQLLTKKDIKKSLNNPLLSFASHGYKHQPLSALSTEKQKHEIEYSKKLLSKLAENRFVNAFSYPFGYPDSINDQVINLVQEAGYAAAFTAQKGIFRPGDSLFTLPRIRMLPNKVNINSFETSSLAQAIDELLLVAFGAEERLAHYNN